LRMSAPIRNSSPSDNEWPSLILLWVTPFKSDFEKKARKISNMKKRREFLTEYTHRQGTRAVEKAWELGDLLWTRYDEKF